MLTEWAPTIAACHNSGRQLVLMITGGGASALTALFTVPGASRLVLEANIPYSIPALTERLGRVPEQACAPATALSMASVAYRQAVELGSGDPLAVPYVGIGCTAALVSERPKRGAHRVYVAAQTATTTQLLSLTLEKGARDRCGEDELAATLVLEAVARACEVAPIPAPALTGTEQVSREFVTAPEELAAVWQRRAGQIWRTPEGAWQSTLATPPAGILSGSFNPLHDGHRRLRDVAERRLGGPVAYEITVANADKPPLDYLTLLQRTTQFTDQPLALTNASTFDQKAAVFPGMTFVVGVDTAERILEPRFYGDTEEGVRRALRAVRDAGCRFLVAGREDHGTFRSLADLNLPAGEADLFLEIPEAEYRSDCSSTDLRRRQTPTN